MQPLVKLLGALIIALSSIALAWEPARNLEYEYALLTSWILVFGLPLIGCLWPRRSSFFKDFLPKFPINISQFFLFLCLPLFSLVPGLIVFAGKQCACSGMGYGFWMSLLVLPAGWLGVAAFIYAIQLDPKPMSRWWAVIGPLLWAFGGAIVLWFFPQKRAVNAFFGFLHGPVYDLWIPLDGGVVWARVSHSILGILLLLLVTSGQREDASRRWWRITVGLMLSLFFGAQITSCTYNSVWHGEWFLNRALPQVIHEKNIELHYFKNSTASEKRAHQLARDAAFHVSEIQGVLGAPIVKPILIYAYSSSDQKKLLFGGGSTDVTDVWTPSVHIELEASPHPTLRHELVHAVGSFVSWHGIGFHPNMLITEGLAVALAPVDESLDFDEISASMIKSGRVGSLIDLVSMLGFWTSSGQRSYVVAGSLLRWLREKYGTEAIREIYRGGAIEAVTRIEWAKVLDLWSSDIAKKHSDNNALVVEHFSRDPGVFGAECPHTVEDLARGRDSSIWTYLRQPLGWESKLWNQWRLAVEPLDREARMNVNREEIATLMKAPVLDLPAIEAWLLAQEKVRVWPPNVAEDLDVELLRSDVEHAIGMKDASATRLTSLVGSFVAKNPGGAMRRQAAVRMELNRMVQDDNSIKWRRYLAGWDPIPSLPNRAPWIYNYLGSRRVLVPTKQQLDLWQSQLVQANSFPELYREWTRQMAAGYAGINEWSEAKNNYISLEKLSYGEAKILAAEHIRRMNSFLEAKASQ